MKSSHNPFTVAGERHAGLIGRCRTARRAEPLSFKPGRERSSRVVTAKRSAGRVLIHLTSDLLWQTSEFAVEIKRLAHPT